jgi:carbamoyltransferase
MKILGIANGETSSACLIDNGKIIAAASEERFSRIKMDDSFPSHSINFVLNFGGVALEKVDQIVYGWSKGFVAQDQLLPYFDRIVYESRNNSQGLSLLRDRLEIELKRDAIKKSIFFDYIKKNNLENKTYYVNHHRAHAFSALSCSGFNSSLVITADGRGDFESLTVSLFKKKTFQNIYRASSNDSLGTFYARISKLLGFTPHKHEGKVTGLSAQGNPKKYIHLMRQMIKFSNGKIYGINGDYFKSFHNDYGKYRAWSKVALNKFGKFKKEDVAAAAQKHLENIILSLIKYYLKRTNAKNICLAGGVFANVLLNQKIREIPGVRNVFIQPHMGDGGLALGAAGEYFFVKTKKHLKFKDMYLGPHYKLNKKLIKDLERKYNVTFLKKKDIPSEVINSLKINKIVGLFQGRMEFGPRSLCNRSIIYHCNNVNINIDLNARLKREEFMPFAPVIAEKFANIALKKWQKKHISSQFMTTTYKCTNFFKKNCPAIVHIDNTVRPQVLNKKVNPIMHKILLKWHDETGKIALLNTSFNQHEEPIVCRPEDAIRSYRSKCVDVLFIDNYRVVFNK